MSNEPEYTPGRRTVHIDDEAYHAERWPVIRADDSTIVGTEGYYGDIEIDKGNARLHAASDNAVIELAEHLGCNAVTLAERLEGGGLVRLVGALLDVAAAYGADARPMVREALSHLTATPTAPR